MILADVVGLGPGSWRWDTALPASYVVGAVSRAGRRCGALGPVASGSDLHAGLAVALDLPSYYGSNLDALADVLRDLDAGWVLVWEGASVLEAAEPRVFRVATELLGERLTLLLTPRAG